MPTNSPGARWRQLRSKTLATAEGRQGYHEGTEQAQTYRETMHLLDSMRATLGISQSELARRLEKSQPTVARLLAHGENPTLATLDQVLRSLGARGRLIIDLAEGDAPENGLVVEVKGSSPETSSR